MYIRRTKLLRLREIFLFSQMKNNTSSTLIYVLANTIFISINGFLNANESFITIDNY